MSEFDTKQKEKIIELESIESQLNRKISELISKINAQSQEIESQKNELESTHPLP